MAPLRTIRLLAGVLAVASTAACATGGRDGAGPERSTPPPSAPSSTSAPTTSVPPAPPPGPQPVVVELSVERRTSDPATEGFEATVADVLADPRGWEQAGFDIVVRPGAGYRVVLAEGPEVDRMCRPYDVGGRFSCQIGPVVALNADRWRTATPSWTGTLEEYRTMLVNHEVGHLLGQHHPEVRCPAPGAPAPVMAQQSGGLAGCAHNAWPLPWEIACAARHEEPLAPGYEEAPEPTCGPDDVAG